MPGCEENFNANQSLYFGQMLAGREVPLHKERNKVWGSTVLCKVAKIHEL